MHGAARVVYFGTPGVAAHVLDNLLEGGVNLVGVVTQPPRPKGRSGRPQESPVAAMVRARGLQIPIIESEKASADEVVDELEKLDADLFVVFAFGQFLGKRLRNTPRLDCINLHPSLLPKYRGAAPIQWALINGDCETGVTIMKVVREMDGGDIIAQARTPIARTETLTDLEKRLCDMGADHLLKAVRDFESGSVTYTPQDPDGVTEAPKLTPEDGELKWEESAEALFNRFRGVTPRPGAWCNVSLRGVQKRLKILACHVGDDGPLSVACAQGQLALDTIQLEGKRPIAAEELLRGYSQADISF